MIVMAIIAIPLYFNYTAYAEGTEALSLASSVTTDIAQFYSENDHYPTNNQSAGAASPTSIASKYVRSVTVASGLIKAKFKRTGVAGKIQGMTLYFVPSAVAGSLVWTCGVDSKSMYKYVPTTCRNTKPVAKP